MTQKGWQNKVIVTGNDFMLNLLSLEQAFRCKAPKALFGQTSAVYGRGLATFLPFLSEGGKKGRSVRGRTENLISNKLMLNLLSLEQAFRCKAPKALFGQTSVVYGRGLATFLPFLSEGGKKGQIVGSAFIPALG